MYRITVLYPKVADLRFDMNYYVNNHVAAVNATLSEGFKGIQVDEVVGSIPSEQPPAFAVIARLDFDTLESLQKALATHGAALMSDIPNFTNVQPTMQISRVV